MSTDRPDPLPEHWPFKSAADADAVEYARLRALGYSALKQAHEMYQQAIKELKCAKNHSAQ